MNIWIALGGIVVGGLLSIAAINVEHRAWMKVFEAAEKIWRPKI